MWDEGGLQKRMTTWASSKLHTSTGFSKIEVFSCLSCNWEGRHRSAFKPDNIIQYCSPVLECTGAVQYPRSAPSYSLDSVCRKQASARINIGLSVTYTRLELSSFYFGIWKQDCRANKKLCNSTALIKPGWVRTRIALATCASKTAC